MKKQVWGMCVVAALAAGHGFATTYTWTQGGTASNWEDPLNWDANGVPPQDEAGADLVFGPNTSGNIGSSPNTAQVTLGSITWETNFQWDNFGNWGNSTYAIIVDTGNPAVDATATFSNGADLSAYYVSWQLNNNLVLSGTGGTGILTVRAYANRAGVNGPGGFIVESGARINFVRTHGSSDYSYTGGVTIRDGATVDVTGRGSGQVSLGDGLLTIEQGGVLNATDSVFAQDARFVIGATGTTDPFISGGGGSWNASGTWNFDLTNAGATVGDSWNIIGIGGTATYDQAEFSVADFTEDSGVWTGSANSATYEFDESTGVLQVTSVISGGTVIAIK